MIINEDYFKDLEITDEDIIDNVEEPEQEHELTLDEFHKLPEQYNHCIMIEIDKIDRDSTFFQTSLIPRITKRLDAIFDMYGIEHSLYVLSSTMQEHCNTVIKLGDYQLFCVEYEKDRLINDTYRFIFIQVFVNYPKFNYKRAFRFLYTSVLNLFRIGIHIDFIGFYSSADDYVTTLYFDFNLKPNRIKVDCYNNITGKSDCELSISDEEKLIGEHQKREFYKSVFRHFFKKEVRVPYKSIDRDVPLKPIDSINLSFHNRTI